MKIKCVHCHINTFLDKKRSDGIFFIYKCLECNHYYQKIDEEIYPIIKPNIFQGIDSNYWPRFKKSTNNSHLLEIHNLNRFSAGLLRKSLEDLILDFVENIAKLLFFKEEQYSILNKIHNGMTINEMKDFLHKHFPNFYYSELIHSFKTTLDINGHYHEEDISLEIMKQTIFRLYELLKKEFFNIKETITFLISKETTNTKLNKEILSFEDIINSFQNSFLEKNKIEEVFNYVFLSRNRPTDIK